MGQASGRVLLLDDGGMGALVAAMLRLEAGASVAAWFWPGPGPAAQRRLVAAQRKVELLAVEQLTGWPSGGAAMGAVDAPGLLDAQGLLAAACEAATLGREELLWPAHAGDDLDALARLTERAGLVERIVALESGNPVRIEAPLLDLTMAQVAELAVDLAAPLEAAWWCRRDGASPCGACGPCLRWEAALSRISPGVPPHVGEG